MINPEFRRNIWLELTSARLILIPILLGMIFLIAYFVDRNALNPYEGTRSTARVLFFIFAFLWGTKAASEALSDEINEHTWDFQRMSPFGAWGMAWGKLLGATSHTWYGAIICLAVMVVADLHVHPPLLVLRFVFLLVASALLCQSIAYQISIHAIIKTRTPRRGSIIGFLIFTLPIGIIFTRLGSKADPFLSKVSDTNAHLIEWYGLSFDLVWFTCISLFLFLAWSLYGAYRLMRMELQYQSLPTAWLGFLIFISVYAGGFLPEAIERLSLTRLTSTLLLSFFITITLLYLLIFSEPKSAVTFRKIMQAWRAKNMKRFGTLLPCWVVTAVVMVLVSLGVLITAPEVSLGEWRIPLKSFIVAAMLFAVRDTLIVLTVNILPFTSRRADQTAMIILVILYILLPSTFAAMGLKRLSFLFFPFNDATSFLNAISSPLLQVVVLLVIFLQKWRRNVQLIETS